MAALCQSLPILPFEFPELPAGARFGDDEGGASAVELAALFPVAAVLLYGGVEMARYYYLENGIQFAASETIRHATNERAIDEPELREAFYGSLGTHEPTLVTNLGFSQSTHTLASVERLEITIDYQFRPVTHVIIPQDLDLNLVVRGLVPIDE